MPLSDGRDIYQDPRHYDRFAKPIADGPDLAFYARQIKRFGEPALEIACGTGRLTIPLAAQGIAITGLDRSEAMLALAKEKASGRGVSVPWVHADARAFDLGRTFSLIFFPANAIAHLLDNESVEACLACVRRHLNAEGAFVVEFFNPSLPLLTRDPHGRYPVQEYDDPNGGGRVIVTENNRYDAATQINHIRWYYRFEATGQEVAADLDMRQFFPQELNALIRCCDFTVEAKYGDYDETPFTGASPRQIIVCRRTK